MKMQKPSQGGDFWISSAKSSHREKGFETHTYRMPLIVMLVCMFQKSSPCRGFFKTLLPVEGFWVLSWYVCLCWYVCFKSPLPVEDFSKPFSLWRVSECKAGMYVCLCKKPDRQRVFEKAWQAEEFWKSLTGREVLKKPHRQRGFEKAPQAEGFWISLTGTGVLDIRIICSTPPHESPKK